MVTARRLVALALLAEPALTALQGHEDPFTNNMLPI